MLIDHLYLWTNGVKFITVLFEKVHMSTEGPFLRARSFNELWNLIMELHIPIPLHGDNMLNGYLSLFFTYKSALRVQWDQWWHFFEKSL